MYTTAAPRSSRRNHSVIKPPTRQLHAGLVASCLLGEGGAHQPVLEPPVGTRVPLVLLPSEGQLPRGGGEHRSPRGSRCLGFLICRMGKLMVELIASR